VKAHDLNITELIQFSNGRVGFQGRRLLIHDLSALGQFRRDLIETVGEKMARRILTRKGLFWGQADAAGMQRLYKWDSLEEWLKAGLRLAEISGKASFELKSCILDEAAGRLKMDLACTESAEVEQQICEMGISTKPICWVTVGYMSGYASYCMGKSVYFVEEKCQATGEAFCTLIGRDIESWGASIESDLPFFHAVDIQKKVLELTRRIRDQQRMIASQRKELVAHSHPTMLAGVEVRSKAFRDVLDLAGRVAAFDTTLLITGETGTGKEVLARHIHGISLRRDKPFVAINCSALPESLLESELFGHRAGAFTGATHDHIGLFEAAQGGTIFLDEIGDISPGLQAKLLRVLQSKEIRPVGERTSRIIDVRVISATNRNLEEMVHKGEFREDLLYRLDVFHITTPPLRCRREDILPLARHFLSEMGRRFKKPSLRFDPATLDILMKHAWPGNIRELENAIEHAAVLCSDGTVTTGLLPTTVYRCFEPAATQISGRTMSPQSIRSIEEAHINQVLAESHGNRARAARILGIGEATLYRKLARLKAGDPNKAQ